MSDTKKEDAKNEAPEVGQMKRGDYLIHVFIEKARQLKAPEGNTVDPIVEVQVLSEKKYTTAKDDIGATGIAVWNEHLFFEPKNLNQEEIEQAKIRIRVLDKGYFKDAVIGVYEFDATYIYFMKDHALLHKWLALSNPASQSFNEVFGYLKISIQVSASGDQQMQITEDNNPDTSDNQVLMPPSIRPEYYQVKFRFFRAEQLPAMDKNLLGRGGSIDAYMICKYMASSLKTTVITAKEGTPVDWNEEFWIPCQLPIMSSRIVMKLYDKDQISDEIVGSLLFNVKEIINEKNGKFFWKNIYGAPLGCSGTNTDLMNSSPELGSTWKGRILMQVTAEKTDKPTCIKKPLGPEIIESAKPYMQPHEYEVIAEVGQGIALPNAEKYSVMIKIADYVIKTEKAGAQENTYNRWGYRYKQTTMKTTYQDIYDIGKVYFYLMSGDNPVCYFKEDIEKFMNPNPDWLWIELLPDLSLGKVTDPQKAGIISVKLSIHDKTTNGPINFEQFPAWKKGPPKRLNVMKVRCFLYQCRDLPAADSDGSSDPYIKVWDTTKEIKKTKVIDDNNNPLFYETFDLTLEADILQNLPPFIFDIYDEDTLSSDFICRAVVPIKEAAYIEGDAIPQPKWHACRLKPQAPQSGEILVSFSIVDSDHSFKTPLSYVRLQDSVDFRENEIEINILGLRDLQSVGILPVKKAFIVFNLKSLVPPDDGRALENLRTQPSAAGSNPTINTMIKFRVPLPQKKLFCPKLTCYVHDYIFKGMSQPLIGTFTIPIGTLNEDLKQERERETQAIAKTLEELDKIMRDEAIVSYNLQETSINFEGPDSFDDMSTIMSSRVRTTALKKSMKVDDEMKQPLLLGAIKEEEDRKSQTGLSQPMTPSRVTPSNLVNSGKQGKNVLKAQKFDKFNSGMKAQLLAEIKEDEDKALRQMEDERKRIQEQMKRTGEQTVKNILFPKYQLDQRLNVYREIDQPPVSLFIGLGWDEEPEQKVRHYRRFYPQELEKVKEIMPNPTPFQTYDLKRGQSRGANQSFFSFGRGKQDESGETSTELVVGRFKGIVTVQSEADRKQYSEQKADLVHNLKLKLNQIALKKTGKGIDVNLDKMDTMEGRMKFDLELEKLGVRHLDITQKLADLESDETLKRLMMNDTKCIVRLYVISAYNLSSRDNGSDSDPYLLLNLGNKVYNERENYQLDNPNPEFYKHYDFESTFPGCPPLVIKLMDYDDIFNDDLIGITTIDLEDRFFSPEWQSIKHKPIEFRNIYHPSTSISQGTVKLWVEIHPTSQPLSEVPIYKITPKPAEEFEVRVVVWDTEDVKCMDSEGTSDVYCRGFFDSREQSKETDTHYRCQNGKASFNYRLIYNVKYPRKDYNFTLQLYDRDFFKSNDIIGDVTINLEDAFHDCSLTKRPLGINKSYYNSYLKDKGIQFDYKDDSSFWVKVKGKDEKTGAFQDNGRVRVQIDIYPKAQAEANKVGDARQEPNHSPFLPPPVGRLSLTLNPLKMFQQLVGPDLRRKIYCFCCLALCIATLIMVAPMVLALCLVNLSLADDYEPDRFSHAELVYPKGKYESLNQDLRNFLENELSNYKKISVEEKEGIHQAQLFFIDAQTGKVGETVFPNYFPLKMLKDMLKQNGFELPRSDL